jgi:hypothetical protein
MALQRVVPQVYDYLNSGQLELIPSADWYRWSDPIDTQQIFAECRRKIAQVSSRFVGLRVTGDSSWVQTAEQRAHFVKYERVVDEAVATAPVLALCTYPAADSTPHDMLNVLTNHRAVLLPDDEAGWRQVDLRCA